MHTKYALYRENKKNDSSRMKLKKSLCSVIFTTHKLHKFTENK